MSAENDLKRWNAFLDKLANKKSLIIVARENGKKYFKWITIKELKILLNI